jgi:DNA polymerase III subunit alpha
MIRVPEWTQNELLAHEKELLGFYITGHPLTPFAPLLERFTLANSRTASALGGRTMTRIGGIVTGVQQGMSKKSGKPYAMVTLEDLEGSFTMLCMNENYDKYRALLETSKALLVVGEVNNDEDRPKIFPTEVMPLEDAPRKYTRQVHLRLNAVHLNEQKLGEILDLVGKFPGKCPLFLCIRQPGGEIVFIETHDKYFVAPSRELQKATDDLLGDETYYARVDTSVPEKPKRAWERKQAEPAMAE